VPRKITTSRAARLRRHRRVRQNLSGTPQKPRLCVFRSLRHIYIQIIDDTTGRTLASATSLDQEIRGNVDGNAKSETAARVGSILAERAKESGISRVVFDRGGYNFHGRVKALAEAARKGGLVF
jgi:large subunit ribosomal protein L18